MVVGVASVFVVKSMFPVVDRTAVTEDKAAMLF
jgi:hypothetical protein